jgi:hypothetical protein
MATQIPTTEASSRKSNNKSKKARISNTSSRNKNDSNSGSGRSRAQSDVHDANAYETDVNDYTTDKEMSYRDLVICSVCDEAIYRSTTQGPSRTCSTCSFSFHNKCSDGGSNVSKESAPSSSSSSRSARASASAVGASPNASDSASSNGWVCKICNLMSMIDNTAEGNNDELSQFFNPGTVDGYPSADNFTKVGSKRGREIDTNSTPDLDTQSTNNTTKSKNKNNFETTKKKAVVVGIGRKKSIVNTEGDLIQFDDQINPNILAALEECESSEFA